MKEPPLPKKKFGDLFELSVRLRWQMLSDDLGEIVRGRRWKRARLCRNWIARRESLGASNYLFRELASADPQEYRKQMRLSVEQFDWVALVFMKVIYLKQILSGKLLFLQDWSLRLPSRFLVSGDYFSSLALLFRIPPCTKIYTRNTAISYFSGKYRPS